jgi:tRNA modification GTPase
VVIGGVPVTLLDTAGLRESADLAERIGVQRSRAAAQQADIVIMVADAQQGWTPGDREIFESVWGGEQAPGEQSAGDSDDGSGARGGGARPPALLVLNKADLAGGQADVASAVPDAARAAFQATVVTSAATGACAASALGGGGRLPSAASPLHMACGIHCFPCPTASPGLLGWLLRGRC